MEGMREVLLNYSGRLIGDILHVKGSKEGKEEFNGEYKVYATIETNYTKITIDWPQEGILPTEYLDTYGFNNKYPVDVEYIEEDDILKLSGEYFEAPYIVTLKLPRR